MNLSLHFPSSLLIVTLVVSSVLPTMSLAQSLNMPDEGQIIREITVEGLGRAGETNARAVIVSRVGEPLDRDQLEQDVDRLLKTTRYLAVRYVLERIDEGVRIRFLIRERRTVTDIAFQGNDDVASRKLRNVLPFKKGDSVDIYKLRQGRDTLISEYQSRGYPEVAVTFDENDIVESGIVEYTIVEGIRSRVRSIRLEGNAQLERSTLISQIDTETAFWFFRDGSFDADTAERDSAKLQRYYRDQGFRDAKVIYRKDLSDDGKDIAVTFLIEEGTRYQIESISIVGNTVYTDAELRRLLVSAESGFIKQRDLDTDREVLQRWYGDYGYIYARVSVEVIFSEEPGLVKVTFSVDEDQQYRVGDVIIRGNTRTRDKVIRRTLDLYPPDDVFNLSAARDAEQELRGSGIFSEGTRVYPTGDAPGVRNATIDVQESEKVGDLIFGVGVSSNSGLVGSIVLDFNNFDLFDPPRSWEELFRLRSFTGGGQRLRLELQPGSNLSRYRIDYIQPYLFDKPLQLSTSAYLFTRLREGYDEQRLGGSAGFGRNHKRGFLQGWGSQIRFRGESVSVKDVDIFAARSIRDVEGTSALGGVEYRLVRDRTDNRFIPTRGDRLRLSYEQLAASSDVFGQLGMQYTWHTTLRRDILDRASVLSINTEVGFILGDAPVYERYYAGGVGSLRGFAFRGVGSREGIANNNVGGDFLLLVSTEYSYPLYDDFVRGFFFLDMGTAENNISISNWRASVGVGVRLVVDVFGRVPMEFAIGVPVSSEERDDEQVFSFSISRSF